MKKFLTILICIIVLCSLPLVVFAEETDAVPEVPVETPTDTEVETPETDVVPEVPEVETPETETPETETPETETKTPVETPKVEDDPNDLSVEKIVDYVKTHYEELSVIATLIISIFYRARNGKSLNKSVATLNNNSIAVAENSEAAIKQALAVMESFEQKVEEYKKATERSIGEITTHLKTTKLANVELANEVAELLILANIPNSKKDELYARHLAAVNAIAEAERIEDTEVNEYEDEA